jgi:hypothetical protein
MMSDFFEFPEPDPEPQETHPRAPPPWMSAPRGVVAGSVPLDFVLARNERAAVAITHLAAYPVGFKFELLVLAADEDEHELDPMIMGPMRRPGRPLGDAQRDMLRFGIQFADGTKVTNLADRVAWQRDEAPKAPVLRSRGGSSDGSEWAQDMWVWPLPPAGPLEFVCEWPAAGLELTRVEIDAQLLIDAAARSQLIFERS